MSSPASRYAVQAALSVIRAHGRVYKSVWALSHAVSEEVGMSDRHVRRVLSDLDVTDIVFSPSTRTRTSCPDSGHHACPDSGHGVLDSDITPASAPDPVETEDAEIDGAYLPTALESSVLPQQPHPTDALRPLKKVIRNRKATWCVLCDGDIEEGAGFIPVPYSSCSPHCGSCWSTLMAWEREMTSTSS